MDLAIAIGQGVGLAVACGLVALLPLAVGSLGALAGILPGALGVYDDVAVAVGTGVAGLVNALLSPRITGTLKIVLAAGAGAAVFQSRPVRRCRTPGSRSARCSAPPPPGSRAGSSIPQPRRAPRAASPRSWPAPASWPRGVALIPFAGYVLLLVAAWFGRRARRAQDRKYAGLRVLR